MTFEEWLSKTTGWSNEEDGWSDDIHTMEEAWNYQQANIDEMLASIKSLITTGDARINELETENRTLREQWEQGAYGMFTKVDEEELKIKNWALRAAIREINALWIANKLADLPTAIRNAYALLEKGNE